MRIGYSFWGFLGSGIVDTPDGGRSHRRTLVEGLRADHEVVFLQTNRDLVEASCDLTQTYEWDLGLPKLDLLMLEWRWPISGRNTTSCGRAEHTCDLHRQDELLAHYTIELGTPTVIWDKDRMIQADSSLRSMANVVICEAALFPEGSARSLLFPINDDVIDSIDAKVLTMNDRPIQLIYIGNQYGRNEAFSKYFAPAAEGRSHLVAGKWPRTGEWPRVNFIGRVGFDEVAPLYTRSLCTLLLLPDRYSRVGQMTQRIFEAVTRGCLPLIPTHVRGADVFTPQRLHVRRGSDVADTIDSIANSRGSAEHMSLIRQSLDRLDIFRLSKQMIALNQIMIEAKERRFMR